MDAFEKECKQHGYQRVAGIDEAGRGALAGPVIAAAVILPDEHAIIGLQDSKLLSQKKRTHLFQQIQHTAIAIGIGTADHLLIDRLNVLEATLVAMREATENIVPLPDYLLVDGLDLPEIDIQGKAIPKGHRRCYSIAAASIIAKVTRDRLMDELARTYPHYKFEKNRGYPTVQHREALLTFGASDVHRHTFKLLPDN